MATTLPTPSPRALTLHDELVTTRKTERRARHRLAILLRDMADGLFVELGYASIVEYGRVALGLSKRVTRDLVELGRRLPELPRLDAAMAAGELDWTKAREIQRVATADTDEAWAEYGKKANSRDVENAVRQAQKGDGQPPAEGQPVRGPTHRRRVLHLESVDADLLDQFVALVRAETDSADVTVEEALVELIRRALVERERSPRADDLLANVEPYRIVLTTCPTCGAVASPESEVSSEVASESACDAEVVDLLPGPSHGHVTRTIPPATRRAVLARDEWRCRVPGCGLRLCLHIHHLRSRAFGGDHDRRWLLTVCGVHHRRTHDGRLTIEREGDTLVVRRADGTRSEAPWPGTAAVTPALREPLPAPPERPAPAPVPAPCG